MLELEAPQPVRAELQIVSAYFSAVRAHDLEQLAATLSPNALFLTHIGSQPQGAAMVWQERLKHFDYRQLGQLAPYSARDTEIYTAEQIAELKRESRFSVLPERQETLVKVIILGEGLRPKPLFAEEVLFILRPDGDRYRISKVVEDFRLP